MGILAIGYALRINSTNASSFFFDIFLPLKVRNKIGRLVTTFALFNNSSGMRPELIWARSKNLYQSSVPFNMCCCNNITTWIYFCQVQKIRDSDHYPLFHLSQIYAQRILLLINQSIPPLPAEMHQPFNPIRKGFSNGVNHLQTCPCKY